MRSAPLSAGHCQIICPLMVAPPGQGLEALGTSLPGSPTFCHPFFPAPHLPLMQGTPPTPHVALCPLHAFLGPMHLLRGDRDPLAALALAVPGGRVELLPSLGPSSRLGSGAGMRPLPSE